MSKFFKQNILIFIGIVFDLIVSSYLPTVFGYQGFIITPYFAVSGLILTVLPLNLSTKLLTSFIFGLYVEIQYFDSYLTFLLSILLVTYLIYISQNAFGNTFFEKSIALFFFISLLSIINFALANLFSMIKISIGAYMTYEFIITILFNIISIVIMLIIESFLIDKRIQRERIKKRSEHISLIE